MASSEGEDEDLKAAIAMSLANEETKSSAATITNGTAGDITNESKVDSLDATSTTHSSFAGLDRKAMEAERLARLNKKRDRPISPPALSSRKAPKLEENTVSLPSGARLTSFSSIINKAQQSRKNEIANAANERMKQLPKGAAKQESDSEQSSNVKLLQGSIRYPKGVVKKTWAFGFNRNDDVKLEEVLEPQTLRTAVLSAYQWQDEWVLSKLKVPPNGDTKCLFVMHEKDDQVRQIMVQKMGDWRKFLRLCFPPMYAPINCMHSKLMLLFHPNKLRIAIPTANLMNFDWGETGVMENSVFMVDLPRLPEGGKAEAEELTAFGKEMLYYLEKQGVDEDVRDGVRNFDFSATQNMMFVHTTGGTHYGEAAERTGLPGLARAIRNLHLQTDESLQIDFAASSIGSLNDDQLRNMHAAARGEDMIARANAATSQAKADFFKPSAAKPPSEGMNIRDKLRIYFPTQDTVTSSIAGAAGTICLSRKWFEAGTFPRTSFRDYVSTRAGLLSHNKILYARGKQKAPDGTTKDVAWAYVGSANMSQSAWGQLVYDKKEKAWKITCRNWECGVLLPVPTDKLAGAHHKGGDAKVKKKKIEGEDSETESEDEGEGNTADAQTLDDDIVGMEIFDDLVSPPFEFPGARYGGRQPWYFQESR